MCYGHHRSFSRDDLIPSRNRPSRDDDNDDGGDESVVQDLRGRLADTEARLQRARAREAELSRQLEEMRRFVSVMEILESYLKRRYREQQQHVARLFSSITPPPK
ncbi:hypothetical protein Tsubulata_002679 [Turnera subulata]|uniref:Protein SKIP34 n=1 Tax=Turnera subulata TaxID=218843 RepID=A0A9Q0F7T7_9ROSI|nr:hypothetical protein Tsubulata_002679 [Turnera subulata]